MNKTKVKKNNSNKYTSDSQKFTMKFFAGVILTIIITPLVAWAGLSITDNGKQIARLDEREKTTRQIIIDTRKDVRDIRNYLLKKTK